jgi:hypothetical protein
MLQEGFQEEMAAEAKSKLKINKVSIHVFILLLKYTLKSSRLASQNLVVQKPKQSLRHMALAEVFLHPNDSDVKRNIPWAVGISLFEASLFLSVPPKPPLPYVSQPKVLVASEDHHCQRFYEPHFAPRWHTGHTGRVNDLNSPNPTYVCWITG